MKIVKEIVSVVSNQGVLDQSRFNRGVSAIAKLTNDNCHGNAISRGAKLLGRSDLVEKVKKINQTHLRVGSLSYELSLDRRKIYDDLQTYAKQVLSSENAKKFYMSY